KKIRVDGPIVLFFMWRFLVRDEERADIDTAIQVLRDNESLQRSTVVYFIEEHHRIPMALAKLNLFSGFLPLIADMPLIEDAIVRCNIIGWLIKNHMAAR